MTTPAIFLDKDGSLLQDVPYNVDPQRMRLAPTVQAGLQTLAHLHMPLIVVSNQPGVELGRLTEDPLDLLQHRLSDMFDACGAELADVCWCPHAPDAQGRPVCECRKPMPGMLIKAAESHEIDLARSWMIGGILDDIEAGRRAGCNTILIDNGNETLWRRGPLRTPHRIVGNLAAAAQVIVAATQARIEARKECS